MKKTKDAVKRLLKEQWEQACNGFIVELLRMWELDAHYGYWIGDESVTFVYADGRRETETFADIVEMARLYILTDCGGSFERFAMWGLLRP